MNDRMVGLTSREVAGWHYRKEYVWQLKRLPVLFPFCSRFAIATG